MNLLPLASKVALLENVMGFARVADKCIDFMENNFARVP